MFRSAESEGLLNSMHPAGFQQAENWISRSICAAMMSITQMVVDRFKRRNFVIDIKPGHDPGITGFAESLSPDWLSSERHQSLGHSINVLRWQQITSVAVDYQFRDAAHGSGDDRQTSAHRLND